MKAFSFRGFEQGGGGRDEDDLGAVKHIAGNHGRGKLKSLRPAKRGAVEELARRLKDGGIEGLLDHASGLKAEGFEGGGGVFRRDVSGALAAANGGIDLKGSGGSDELAIVLHGLHEVDERIGSLTSHKEPNEGGGLEEITGHAFPRSSWIASAMESPWTWMGWKRCASSGMPASARLRRMVVVG